MNEPINQWKEKSGLVNKNKFEQTWAVGFLNEGVNSEYNFLVTALTPDLINPENVFAAATKEFSNIKGEIKITKMQPINDISPHE